MNIENFPFGEVVTKKSSIDDVIDSVMDFVLHDNEDRTIMHEPKGILIVEVLNAYVKAGATHELAEGFRIVEYMYGFGVCWEQSYGEVWCKEERPYSYQGEHLNRYDP